MKSRMTGGKVAVVGGGVCEFVVDLEQILVGEKCGEREDLLEGPSPTSDTAQTAKKERNRESLNEWKETVTALPRVA